MYQFCTFFKFVKIFSRSKIQRFETGYERISRTMETQSDLKTDLVGIQKLFHIRNTFDVHGFAKAILEKSTISNGSFALLNQLENSGLALFQTIKSKIRRKSSSRTEFKYMSE
jgi:hypothetical protein